MDTLSQPLKTLVTADDLARFSDDGHYELIRGELREMAPAGAEHGYTLITLSGFATVHAVLHDLGPCFGAETGFWIERDPDTVLAPDWAFISKARLRGPIERGFNTLVPDLVLETRSPGDTAPEVAAKVERWLSAGVRIVWELDPKRQVLMVHRPGSPPVRLAIDDTLAGGDVLPGFSIPLRRVLAHTLKGR